MSNFSLRALSILTSTYIIVATTVGSAVMGFALADWIIGTFFLPDCSRIPTVHSVPSFEEVEYCWQEKGIKILQNEN